MTDKVETKNEPEEVIVEESSVPWYKNIKVIVILFLAFIICLLLVMIFVFAMLYLFGRGDDKTSDKPKKKKKKKPAEENEIDPNEIDIDELENEIMDAEQERQAEIRKKCDEIVASQFVDEEYSTADIDNTSSYDDMQNDGYEPQKEHNDYPVKTMPNFEKTDVDSFYNDNFIEDDNSDNKVVELEL